MKKARKKQKKPRRSGEGPRPLRPHKHKTTRRVIVVQPGDPEPPICPDFDKRIEERNRLHKSSWGKWYPKQPPAFWHEALRRGKTIAGMERRDGIATVTSNKYLTACGIEYDRSHVPQACREAIAWEAEAEAFCQSLCWDKTKADIPSLDPGKSWLIVPCPHFPTASGLEFRRIFAVVKHEKPDAVLIPGDLGNFEALSKFAMKDRGKMPRLQTEIDKMREILSLLARIFDREVVVMLANHEARLLHTLRNELDAEDLFESLLKSARFMDKRMVRIGRYLIMHQHGRKVASSAPNELSLRYGGPVYIAGSHRFVDGYSQAGEPCGMLGCTCSIPDMHYHSEEPNYNEWNNAFEILRAGRMTGYRDPHTDWSKFGVS